MKTINLLAIGFLLLTVASCKKSENGKTSNKDVLAVKSDSVIVNETHKEFYGLYSGDFNAVTNQYDQEGVSEDEYYKKLTLKINRITNDSVYGQSIVNGNQRSFRGVYNENSKTFILDEPGNDKTDGRFTVKIDGDSLTGNWLAFKSSEVKLPNKKLKLIKKEFVYNANFMLEPDLNGEASGTVVDWSNPKNKKFNYKDEDGTQQSYESEVYRVASDEIFKINASKQKLIEKDLKNLRKLDIEIIKNTVFARHGYSFKKKTFRNFFETTDWYVPVSNNVDAEMSPLEKENVALLNRFTKYAEDKYDSFGR